MQSPDPPLFGCLNKVGSLSLARVMLSLSLKRYYEPLRLPIQPEGLSASLISSSCQPCAATILGLPHCSVILPIHAIPATPRDHQDDSVIISQHSGLLHMTIGSASPNSDEATYRFTYVTACIFALRKLTTPGYPDAASRY